MHYGLVFLAFAVAFAFQAFAWGGWWSLLLWPALSFALVGVAYLTSRPTMLGKRADGRLSPIVVATVLPFTAFAWSVWHAQRLMHRGPMACEVSPGIWLGRRAGLRELPPGISTVIDLTAEFWEPRGVSAGRQYVCVPTLDATASGEVAFRAALECVAAADGPVYIHCAQGFGRSAALVAAVLIRRGIAQDVRDAEAILARVRPGVRLYPQQRALVRRVTTTTSG